MKIIVIIQARLTSTRLPGKVLKQLGDSTAVSYTHLDVYKRQLKDTGRAVNIENVKCLEATMMQCLNENSEIRQSLSIGNSEFDNKTNAAQNIVNVIREFLE